MGNCLIAQYETKEVKESDDGSSSIQKRENRYQDMTGI
jgi:hypothetical protein